MVNKPVYITPKGLEELKAELDHLINVRRPDLAKRLHFAIKQGDLSENADYIAAKEEQGFLEGRILELEQSINNAVLIESSGNTDGIINLGSHITVMEEDYDEEETYHLVGATEADPTKGRISNESPLGQALLGKRVGDVVAIRAPAGEIRFRIVRID